MCPVTKNSKLLWQDSSFNDDDDVIVSETVGI
jgi:hypothetical protein